MDKEKFFCEIHELIQKFKYAKALNNLSNFLNSNYCYDSYDKIITYYYLALCYISIDSTNNAKKYILKIINNKGHLDYPVLQLAGFIMYCASSYTSALQYYTKALDYTDNNIELSTTYCDMAICCGKLNMMKEERAFYEYSVKKYPLNPYPFNNMATFYANNNDLRNMHYCLEKCIKLLSEENEFTNLYKYDCEMLIDHIIADPDYIDCKDDILRLMLSYGCINNHKYKMHKKLHDITTKKKLKNENHPTVNIMDVKLKDSNVASLGPGATSRESYLEKIDK